LEGGDLGSREENLARIQKDNLNEGEKGSQKSFQIGWEVGMGRRSGRWTNKCITSRGRRKGTKLESRGK